MDTTQDVLSAILTRSPEEVEAWLDGQSIGEDVDGSQFNWEVFAFTAAARAGDERSTAWARIALRIYAALAARAAPRIAHAYRFSAMNLRARMISELGVRDGDRVLDLQPLIDWFQRLATVSLDEATSLATTSELRAISPTHLVTLRDLKNALNVLALLAISGEVPGHPELTGWLQLRPRLP
ncbi:hypothetical protein DRW03_06875 [Corallococcus sp. H22C18031201]|uniref:hypothetical protein n=1 Tax=Citreicoccus inhibens TaxID=2849499 RepID=UPI000E74042D|nr:hypothetical protein [Citreicoccus inhibens]MBU8895274.1 hypothetical protein [Citreicoccus inhibens]RJS26171.1 hypothetical protein DRW03_06875 [Corallococcus sp. H22C18031201]